MAEQKYIDFLNKIILKTKEEKISWDYLDSSPSLYKGMGWTKTAIEYALLSGNTEKVIADFNTENSFYTNIGRTYIVIYVWGNQPAKLFVVPNTYKKVVVLTPDEYGEYITRLLNLVQSQFPSGETFIDDYLSRDK